jgi:hypothetical protein
MSSRTRTRADLALLGVTSAIADAMPATNADGSANLAAQNAAISSIVSAALADSLVTAPAQSTQQDLTWFSEDRVLAGTIGLQHRHASISATSGGRVALPSYHSSQ